MVLDDPSLRLVGGIIWRSPRTMFGFVTPLRVGRTDVWLLKWMCSRWETNGLGLRCVKGFLDAKDTGSRFRLISLIGGLESGLVG
jgi:hypothetical protein